MYTEQQSTAAVRLFRAGGIGEGEGHRLAAAGLGEAIGGGGKSGWALVNGGDEGEGGTGEGTVWKRNGMFNEDPVQKTHLEGKGMDAVVGVI